MLVPLPMRLGAVDMDCDEIEVDEPGVYDVQVRPGQG